MPVNPGPLRNVRLEDLSAVLFDMDGTLVDSEVLWRRAEREWIGSYGHAFEPEMHASFHGMSLASMIGQVRDHFDLEPSEAELAAELEARVLALLPDAREKPGASELIAFLEARGVPMALASNSSRTMVEAALAGMPWVSSLACRFSADDVAAGKPAPDLYLLAARAVGVAPGRCLVVEDSLSGVRAALAAGMTCVAVPEEHADSAPFRSLTPHVVYGLDAIRVQLESPA